MVCILCQKASKVEYTGKEFTFFFPDSTFQRASYFFIMEKKMEKKKSKKKFSKKKKEVGKSKSKSEKKKKHNTWKKKKKDEGPANREFSVGRAVKDSALSLLWCGFHP